MDSEVHRENSSRHDLINVEDKLIKLTLYLKTTEMYNF